MALSKCVRCAKLFNKIKTPVCMRCIPDEDRDFQTVRDTLADHPDLNAEAVAELSGVSLDCVLRMLDSGLIANVALGGSAKCGRCGAPAISATKKLCQPCVEKLNQEVAKTRQGIKLSEKKKTEFGSIGVRQSLEEKH